MNAEQAAEWNRDPDAYAAKALGLSSKAEYYEWLDCYGFPLCGAKTKAGLPCKHTQRWKALHRIGYCYVHTDKSSEGDSR